MARRPAPGTPSSDATAARPGRADGTGAPALASAATPAEWLTAAEAAARLGVTRRTLYAYVSRGHLQAHSGPGPGQRRYARTEVDVLAARHAAARQPRRVAVQTLDWGLPVLASGLTLIDGGHLYYRGHDAVALAEQATLEDTAALLWGCSVHEAFSPAAGLAAPCTRVAAAPGRADLTALPEPQRTVAAWAARLAGRPDLGAATSSPAQAGALLRAMAAACTGVDTGPGTNARPSQAAGTAAAPAATALHQQLAVAWGLAPGAADLLRRALVLCADHELNASSFTARCVAATGAGLAASVTAGLAALSGPRHGGMTGRVEALWPELMQRDTDTLCRWLQDEMSRRLQQRQARGQTRRPGDLIAGFGHPLYPQGDPRARALLALLPPDAARQHCLALVHDLTGQQPALDFALVALRRALGAPAGAAFAVFALARTAGWLAHALEQQADGGLIRPRAAYVGPLPAPAAATAGPVGRVIRRR